MYYVHFFNLHDVIIPGMGRGVIALRRFLKNEIVVDYHGIDTEGQTMESYCGVDPANRYFEYIIEVRLGRNASASLMRPLIPVPYIWATDAWEGS